VAASVLAQRRVLLVAPQRRGSLGTFCQRALSELGQTARILAPPPVLRAGVESHFVRAGVRARRLAGYVAHNLRLVLVARALRPHVVLVLKGREIHPATLRLVREQARSALVNWNPDSPFNPANSSAWLLRGIPAYDCHFAWSRSVGRKLEKAGARRVEYLPFAYDPGFHSPSRPGRDRLVDLQSDVCFVGTWDAERERLLRELADWDLGVWGDLWQENAVWPELDVHWRGPAVYGRAMCEIYAAAKIVLNPLREQNRGAHNMRTFEVPAAGAFMLATRSADHEELLGEGGGVACFGDAAELREKVAYYVEREAERRAIAQQGYEIITRGEHTYRDRMLTLLETIQELEARKQDRT